MTHGAGPGAVPLCLLPALAKQPAFAAAAAEWSDGSQEEHHPSNNTTPDHAEDTWSLCQRFLARLDICSQSGGIGTSVPAEVAVAAGSEEEDGWLTGNS